MPPLQRPPPPRRRHHRQKKIRIKTEPVDSPTEISVKAEPLDSLEAFETPASNANVQPAAATAMIKSGKRRVVFL